jgi:NAD(P)-dependent dehydrogenase (short-subunit alcohol dehydrogenase family)
MSDYQNPVVAALTGAYEAMTARPVDRSLPPGLRLEGQTFLITGANRGLGRGIADHLARRGAHLVVLCRSMLEETVADLRRIAGHDHVHGISVDLSSLASVDAALDQLETLDKLDRVILNAGMVPTRSRTTGDGFDVMFQVNFLANVRLVDGIVARGRLVDASSRVVVVGSEAHRSAPSIDFETFGEPWSYTASGAVRFYGYSKLHLHTWASELRRRLAGEAVVLHMCPGAIDSNIAHELPPMLEGVVKLLMRFTFQPPEKAALPVVWLAASPDAPALDTGYLHMTRERLPSDDAIDTERGARLWAEAHRLLDGAAHP